MSDKEGMKDEFDVEKALDYLRDNARAAAMSRAERIYMEEYTRSVKSQIMQESIRDTLGAQERNAYSDGRYVDHLKAMKTAIEKDEYHRWMMKAAEARIEAWRTMQANNRAMEKIR